MQFNTLFYVYANFSFLVKPHKVALSPIVDQASLSMDLYVVKIIEVNGKKIFICMPTACIHNYISGAKDEGL